MSALVRSVPLLDRRRTLKRAGFGWIAVQLAGATTWLTPAEAHAARVPLKVLGPQEAELLEQFGDVLLPGAREAGLVNFIDHHLAVDSADSLLMLRYLDWPAPYAGFYKGGLAAMGAALRARFRRDAADLSSAEWGAFIAEMNQGQPAGWQGIPAGLFYFAVRSDAVDVVYGTEAGFARLGVPYMAHIPPSTPW